MSVLTEWFFEKRKRKNAVHRGRSTYKHHGTQSVKVMVNLKLTYSHNQYYELI